MAGRQKDIYLAELIDADSELARELSSISVTLFSDKDDEDIVDFHATNSSVSNDSVSVSSPGSLVDGCNSSVSSIQQKTSIKSCRRPCLKQKQYIQNLMFRLRRICNHPLLYRGYYTPEQISAVIHYFHSQVDGFRDQPLEKVKAEIDTWCDYEIHQVGN